MKVRFDAKFPGGGEQTLAGDRTPDSCPRCHREIEVQPFFSALVQQDESRTNFVQAVYRCPFTTCNELFIGTYRHSEGALRLWQVVPTKPKAQRHADAITRLSPAFVSIYDQAVAAEAHQLNQLVGVGLRKALEFLIKDYLIQQRPGEADTIKSTLLGGCIERYVDDANVKECARRAAWLGNDETHYARRWEDKDISDLKTLVRLTTNWVENALLTRQYLEQMQQPQR